MPLVLVFKLEATVRAGVMLEVDVEVGSDEEEVEVFAELLEVLDTVGVALLLLEPHKRGGVPYFKVQ